MGSGVSALVRLAFELAARPNGDRTPRGTRGSRASGGHASERAIPATRRRIQVLFSTHSMDFIDALLAEATPADREGLAVFRVARQGGVLKTTRIEMTCWPHVQP